MGLFKNNKKNYSEALNKNIETENSAENQTEAENTNSEEILPESNDFSEDILQNKDSQSDFSKEEKSCDKPLADLCDTAKIFGVSEEKLASEFNAYKAIKLFGRMNFFAADCSFSDQELNRCIKNSVEAGFGSVTVLPYKLDSAIKFAGGKIDVRVALCYPFGAETFKSKTSALGKLAKKKISAVELYFAVSDLVDKKPKAIVREWKKYKRKLGKVKLIMAVDFDTLTLNEISSVCKIAKDVGVEKIKTTTCLLKDGYQDFAVGGILNCLEGLVYEAGAKRLDATAALSMFNWGADTVTSPEVFEVAKSIKRILGCK